MGAALRGDLHVDASACRTMADTLWTAGVSQEERAREMGALCREQGLSQLQLSSASSFIGKPAPPTKRARRDVVPESQAFH